MLLKTKNKTRIGGVYKWMGVGGRCHIVVLDFILFVLMDTGDVCITSTVEG